MSILMPLIRRRESPAISSSRRAAADTDAPTQTSPQTLARASARRHPPPPAARRRLHDRPRHMREAIQTLTPCRYPNNRCAPTAHLGSTHGRPEVMSFPGASRAAIGQGANRVEGEQWVHDINETHRVLTLPPPPAEVMHKVADTASVAAKSAVSSITNALGIKKEALPKLIQEVISTDALHAFAWSRAVQYRAVPCHVTAHRRNLVVAKHKRPAWPLKLSRSNPSPFLAPFCTRSVQVCQRPEGVPDRRQAWG
jgi:hypothetical protein